ncbi:hypothetical protein COEREDRAFT_102113 [Coemansia reversa NRRL 1564]|uniref:SH3 domain-containing protein n=1 Tax=Coemansia reversa (strain ATCC 12441 / NRRL 1564) TaxID=763665 RepID=A0A2G5BCJ0_COERN|nr:hypothetical protein COEREDRAFT_102113 [Coemansia reversa NRRL 1564]|eukprot:PIA16726.1 hypothetical protein COEREDRAFT_102113 [Coemansia reversa NRRL 1564]
MADKHPTKESNLFKALYGYNATKPEELKLSPGDIVTVSNNSHPSWWEGYNETTKVSGWFPSNFVSKIENKPKPKLVRIIKQYVATEKDDLSLEVEDIVEVKKEVDGWCYGHFNGRKGMFPASYSEEYSIEEAPVSRPLPVPPTPTQLGRRGTASGGTGVTSPPQQPPPSLPSRNQPPLPARASTDISAAMAGGIVQPEMQGMVTSPLSEEDVESGKKEKSKSSKRISRLFGTKKHKHKDVPAETVEPVSTSRGAPADEPLQVVPTVYEQESSESPAPSKPLPQPNMASPPPPGARAMPPLPPTGLGKPPPVPAAAMPPAPAPAFVDAPTPAPAPAPQLTSPLPNPPALNVGGSPAAAQAPSLPAAKPQTTEGKIAEGTADAAKDNQLPAESAGDKDTGAADDLDTTDSKVEAAKPRVAAKLAKIVKDYEAQSSEELNLMLDDVVTIISRGNDNEPRWKGEYHGKKGYFPADVVETIEESAALDEEEGDASTAGTRPKSGFKLAAYGVQQGGLGSIFAGGGMPALRRPSQRNPSDTESLTESSAPAPAPAAAPAMPKLRSIPRSTTKEAVPKEEDQQQQQPNFLSQLNHIPRRPTTSISSEDSISVSPHPMAAPAIPRPKEPENPIHEADSEHEHEPPASAQNTAAEETTVNDISLESRDVPETSASPADETVPRESISARPVSASTIPVDNEPGTSLAQPEVLGEEIPTASELAEDEANAAAKASAYDPIKTPALPQVKRLVRRGPRQMPTAEGLKMSSGESQAQALHGALQKDKDLEPESEPEVTKPVPPPTAEKPKGLSRHGPYGGPQLPTGGFRASGRIGSAMASRLAALQARANGAEDGDEESSSPSQNAPRSADSMSPPHNAPRSVDPTSPPQPPFSKKPSFSPRAQTDAYTKPPSSAPGSAAAAVSSEWQKRVEDDQALLRKEVSEAKRNGEQVIQLSARLEASERENQAHKQTISSLERQIETLVSQLSSLRTDISGIQQSVAANSSAKGLSSDEVSTIIRSELKSALEPINRQSQELRGESKNLDKKIADLRHYVDELVVEEEEQ